MTLAHQRGRHVIEAARSFYAGHFSYVAESLGVSLEAARAHCEYMLKTPVDGGTEAALAAIEPRALASLIAIGMNDPFKKG